MKNEVLLEKRFHKSTILLYLKKFAILEERYKILQKWGLNQHTENIFLTKVPVGESSNYKNLFSSSPYLMYFVNWWGFIVVYRAKVRVRIEMR